MTSFCNTPSAADYGKIVRVSTREIEIFCNYSAVLDIVSRDEVFFVARQSVPTR